VYKPENLDAALGVGLSAGGNWTIVPKVELELAGGFFHVFNDGTEIDFLTLKAGVKITP
jgi:hypothetical protein